MGHTMHTHLIGNAEMQMMKRVTRMRIPLPVAAGDVAIPLLLRKRVRIPMPVAAGGVAIPLLLRTKRQKLKDKYRFPPTIQVIDDIPSKFDVGKRMKFESVKPDDSGVYACRARIQGPTKRNLPYDE